MAALLPGVPAVRLASRLQLATSFFPSSSSSSSSRRGSVGPPPALMVDVRVVVRRHFRVAGPCGVRVVEKVAEDIALRRRPSRKLRGREHVERALAEDVLPRVKHPFDRGAVVAASKEISAHLSAASADPRLAEGGARVLVLIDTFACPVVFRPPPPPPCKLLQSTGAPKSFVVTSINTCMGLKSGSPVKETKQPIGVIGDGRPRPVEQRLEGWLPW
ncbi:hypothetical protein ACP70R_012461 [Stipagrostis hirtigluma subsp. patula]